MKSEYLARLETKLNQLQRHKGRALTEDDVPPGIARKADRMGHPLGKSKGKKK